MPELVILIQCRDQKGLVSRISTFWFERGFNILDSQQHVDTAQGRFFMRLRIDMDNRVWPDDGLSAQFQLLADELGLTWSARKITAPARVAIMVSKTSHCLYDLIVRQREGELPCEIVLIASNHPDLEAVAGQFGVPYHHLPVSPDMKSAQEAKLVSLLEQNRIDLVILARYMQILSEAVVTTYPSRIINIHHGFLPAFQGANAYQRAYEHGVKIIGATAHYVTADLDEGPIIEQDVERVSHADSPRELARIGRDIERIVLARAVKAHLEHRVIVAGRRTIVFSPGA